MANNHDRYSVPIYSDKVKKYTIQENKPTSFRKPLRRHFQDYCSSTSIHGFAYFGENRTCIEYIFWAAVFILSICAAVYMIYGVYEKWYYSPVLVSFATRNTPIFDIPFPAVTICPTTFFDRSKFNKTEYIKKISSGQSGTDEEKFIASFLDLVCDANNTFTGTFRSESQDEPFSERFYEYFLNNAPKRSYIIYYRDEEYKFDDFFKPTITQAGLCYTFNRLRLDEIFRDTVVLDNRDNDFNHSDWDQEFGYSTSTGIEAYPRRALFSGIHNALQIVIIEDKKSVGAFCRTIFQGYLISLHLPSIIPKTGEEFFFLPLNDAVLGPITGSVILTSDKVQNYSPSKRDCYFPSERNLRYFAMYNKKNCEMECFTNTTLKHCGCVEYYMPRENGTKICKNSDLECANKWQENSRIRSLKRKIDERRNTDEEECNCLSVCSHVTYKTNVAPLSLDKNDLLSDTEDYSEYFESSFDKDAEIATSLLILYFEDDSLTTTERNELYGPLDFLSNFGGLLGLFTGFSILSCVEIVYFCSLRIFGNIKLFGHWAGPPDPDT